MFLRFDSIGKRFGGVTALDDVSFDVERGTVHAIVGENGAGKSTLMKIVSGVYPSGQYDGSFSIDGKPCRFASIGQAEEGGVALIPQELAVIGDMTVAENLFLNAWPSRFGVIDWDLLHNETRRHLDSIGLQVAFDAPMKSLSAAQQQMVLIAKALSKNARILVFDEPTSSLSLAETDVLFDRIRDLRGRGITALYISHKLDEIIAISDSTTVLRDGRFVLTEPTSTLTPDAIASHMVGRQMSSMYPRTTKTPGETALQVRGLRAYPADLPETEQNARLHGIDLAARRGEILGIYGLVGAGRTELLLSLFGAWPGKVTFDAFTVFGGAVAQASPETMLGHGVGLLGEDRKKSGIIPNKSLRWNVTLASLRKISRHAVLDELLERVRPDRYLKDLRVKAPSSDVDIDNLSGGNQQKVLIGRWLSAESRILLLDDPTRGVDIGAKVEIFEILNRLAAEGVAIVFVTSELPEVLGIADRIVVMHEGRIAAELDWRDASEQKIIQFAAGSA